MHFTCNILRYDSIARIGYYLALDVSNAMLSAFILPFTGFQWEFQYLFGNQFFPDSIHGKICQNRYSRMGRSSINTL